MSSTMSPFPNAAWRGAAPEPRPRGALGTFGWPESLEEKTPGEGWGGARGCSTPAVFAPGVCGHSLGRWRGRAAGLDEQHLACPSSSSQSLSQLQLPAPVPQVTPSHPSQRAAAAALAFPAFCFCKSVFCTFCICFFAAPLQQSCLCSPARGSWRLLQLLFSVWGFKAPALPVPSHCPGSSCTTAEWEAQLCGRAFPQPGWH